ncbi:FAD/NAD(P)-binding domain-containing protein [Wilcoxina mikolae CBS 423.85]|nr:FAD/NAD(P)-binding domain-containing protein [Wilcoxina mikolae CBS 423.85]
MNLLTLSLFSLLTLTCAQTAPEYDYIVVGSGAGGLVAADRLSETGAKTLLIERGPASTWENGGRQGPDWATSQNLTRYDIPGLGNSVWVSVPTTPSTKCDDYNELAACVLGGGTAINAALFFRPPEQDWDTWPNGWNAPDMRNATEKFPYQLLSGVLSSAGWEEVQANQQPNRKNHTFAHGPFMFAGGERGGPLATYLRTALARPNFQLMLNTTVARVLRKGSKILGVTTSTGRNITAKTIVLSAGSFGTPKILFRSGIGPFDQLRIVNVSSDAPFLPPENEWILLPVGENLMDHANMDMNISHPAMQGYDFIGAYNNPIPADRLEYTSFRSGPLAEAVPAPNAVLWDTVVVGKTERTAQWTTRVGGSRDDKTIGLGHFLGRHSTSRGRISIFPNLTISVTQKPWANTDDDIAAITATISSLLVALRADPQITMIAPPANETAAEFVATYKGARGSNHWLGTARMGSLDGRVFNGFSGDVVDTHAKVYGTENLYVADGSVFPWLTTTNPSAPIMVVAERVVERILGL